MTRSFPLRQAIFHSLFQIPERSPSALERQLPSSFTSTDRRRLDGELMENRVLQRPVFLIIRFVEGGKTGGFVIDELGGSKKYP